jgi:hypothetical protein
MGNLCNKTIPNTVDVDLDNEIANNKCFNCPKFTSSCCENDTLMCCIRISKDQLEVCKIKRKPSP